ncbi:LOW QUALITY PROTEIN: hypothetical protein OSB04_020330 [Centaurea solstitialis]|uniref:Integrase catalytic domain-containing protein n=1 Tax=Centaurea solstitialis TaxID=347529 RepID=A0AA38W5S8_9ASTR|nr:LOW QUALITY PROTEIN: hypothetical protein OSB04_020330 [Centaurea solstitialis]
MRLSVEFGEQIVKSSGPKRRNPIWKLKFSESDLAQNTGCGKGTFPIRKMEQNPKSEACFPIRKMIFSDSEKRRLVSGLSETRLSKDTLCPACEQGKMKRTLHPLKMETNCKSPINMIHMDLCGPIRVESLDRKKYMLVLVDEFSRAKYDAPDLIIAFIKRIQTLLGCKVKKLRSNKRTEFRNAKLQSFLEDVGISHNFFAVRTIQQNGVVERNKRTLVEEVRSMMAHLGVPQSVWAEAISSTCFNQTLIVTQTSKTAYKMINEHKSNIDFLKKAKPIQMSLSSLDTHLTQSTTTPSTTFAPNTFASDFIDFTDYDLPTLTAPIVVAAEPDPSSTSVSSDTFFTKSSSMPTVDADTSIETVTPEPVVSPPKILPTNDRQKMNGTDRSQHRTSHKPSKRIFLWDQLWIFAIHDENDAANNQQEYDTLPHSRKWTKSHSSSQIIGSPSKPVRTGSTKNTDNKVLYAGFLSDFEPSETQQALSDPDWVKAMQEELAEFERNMVRQLVAKPRGKSIIAMKMGLLFETKPDWSPSDIVNKRVSITTRLLLLFPDSKLTKI